MLSAFLSVEVVEEATTDAIQAAEMTHTLPFPADRDELVAACHAQEARAVL